MREITNQVAPEPFRWTAEALLATQEVRWLFSSWGLMRGSKALPAASMNHSMDHSSQVGRLGLLRPICWAPAVLRCCDRRADHCRLLAHVCKDKPRHKPVQRVSGLRPGQRCSINRRALPISLLQATEDFMVHLLEDCNLCAIHAKRVTISASPSSLADDTLHSSPPVCNQPCP